MSPEALKRLQQGGTDRLVDLLLDDVLDRPVEELLDPVWFSRQLVVTARAAAKDPKLEAQLKERIRELKKKVPSGSLELPSSIRKPLQEVLKKPYKPDRVLVGRLLDHETARLLLKTTFQDMLVGFARKLKPILPPKAPGGLGALGGRLGRISETVMGAVGQELEAHVEERAREFMEAGVSRLVQTMADHLCDPRFTREYGEWRAYGLDVFLSTDRRVLAGELEKLDPDALVGTGAAIIRAFIERAELEAELTVILKAVMRETGGKSIRALLEEVGTEAAQQGIGAVRELLKNRARVVVETPAFAAWWSDVVEEP
jgi:hypothetical protein